ncbi:MAG: AAA family ATPase, partial [Bacteroidota bacterium]
KFADFDEFIGQLAEKREEIYSAFESRKLSLMEARNKRANALQSAADRILKGVKSKVSGFQSVNEINGYFASDMMIEKIRDIVSKLQDMGDSVKADEIQSRMKTIREDVVRQLKDRQEMFVGGEDVIKFGRHHFSVNVQNLDLTILQRDENMYYHLTGTNFFQEIESDDFLATREVWSQEVLSENTLVYRAEYLAYKIYQEATSHVAHNGKSNGQSSEKLIPDISRLAEIEEEELQALIQKFMSSRYQEAYVKGVHDQDALKILKGLIELNQSIDLLRYPSSARACAAYYWKEYLKKDPEARKLIQSQLKGIGLILQVFPNTKDFRLEIQDLQKKIHTFIEETRLFPESIARLAGEYLFYEITRDASFIISQEAGRLYESFHRYLEKSKNTKAYDTSLKDLKDAPLERFEMLRNWLEAFVNQARLDEQGEFVEEYLDEAASLLFHESFDPKLVIHSSVRMDIAGMLGSHGQIEDKSYVLHYNDFMLK